MKKAYWAPALVLLVLAGILWFEQDRRARTADLPRLQCQDLSAGCDASLGGRVVSVGMDAKPQAMKPFRIWVRAPGARSVRAEFSMEAMDMGLNLYTLHADREGMFHGSVTLPVCVSGSQDWLMTLDVDGERLIIPIVISL